MNTNKLNRIKTSDYFFSKETKFDGEEKILNFLQSYQKDHPLWNFYNTCKKNSYKKTDSINQTHNKKQSIECFFSNHDKDKDEEKKTMIEFILKNFGWQYIGQNSIQPSGKF